MKLRLYHYWRSSSSWRVRWALALKGIPCEYVPINLLSDEPESEAHLKRNPLGLVPVLELLDSKSTLQYLTESTAILEWLEELYPKPALLPENPEWRARTRQLAQIINADTQPLQNPGVAQHYTNDAQEQKNWNRYWIHRGLKAYETVVGETQGVFSVGDSLTFADLCLIPQCYNAIRHDLALSEFPRIEKIYSKAMQTPSCLTSAPDKFQPK
jgi:maleylacetoacetate isomerase